MKSIRSVALFAAAMISLSLSTPRSFGQFVKWTFETSAPAGSPGANHFITNILAEVGTGTASGLHVGNAAYSSPAGNNSQKSFSVNTWVVGDFFQFATSATGQTNLVVSFDQVASATGPGDFNFSYSLDGTSFTNFGATYLVTNAPGWSSNSAGSAAESFSFNLSSVPALNNASVVYFRITDASTEASSQTNTTQSGGTCRVDNFAVAIVTPPAITSVTPSTLTTNAGSTATFTTVATGGPPLSYFWYSNSVSSGNLLTTQTNAALVLSNVLAASSGTYIVVVSNSTGQLATSGPVTLTVIDPAIIAQPDPTQNLLLGTTANLNVRAAGTGSLTYLWCTGDPNPVDNSFTPVTASAHFSGVTTPTLTISGVTAGDATSGTVNNFFCIVSNSASSFAVSTPVNINVVSTGGTVALFDFNGFFVPATPFSTVGNGTGAISNVTASIFTPPSDAIDLIPENVSPQVIAGNSWSTANYPAATVSNLTAGAQLFISTVGAQNIKIGYDVRQTATSSKYTRLQYTTDGGATWISYPSSTAFIGTASQFANTPPTYDLTGLAGVANNANFGIRIVSEFISTATYGANSTNSYVGLVGTASSYGTTGTMVYDLIKVTGDALSSPFTPPTVAPIANQTIPDTGSTSVPITVSGGTGTLTVTANSLDTTIISSATAVGTTSVLLSPSGLDGRTPVTVTATDSVGNATTVSFIVTTVPANQAPVITGLVSTNSLVNATVTIPFTITDDHTPTNGQPFTTTAVSGNTSLVSSGAIHITGGTTGSPTLSITPDATNQFGVVPITITVNDNDLNTPKSTSSTFILEIRPSTNIVLNDNFTYNGSGSLVTNSAGFWVNHSGTNGDLLYSSGSITVDGLNKSEDAGALLIGAPFPTNTSGVLFARYEINFTTLPILQNGNDGTYISHFKDLGSVNFFCKVFASTNASAPGFYRIGIADGPGVVSSNAVFVPVDLALNTTYTVVSKMVLSNAFSTVWVNPMSTNDLSASDPNFGAATNLTNVSMYAFRQGQGGGTVTVSDLRVGKSFTDVVDTLSVTPLDSLGNVVVTWGSPSFTLQGSTNVVGTYTNIVGATSPYTNAATSPTKFFRLHELRGQSGGN